MKQAATVRQSTNPAPRSGNLHAVDHRVGREWRWARNGHRGGVLWFTGLSGSGKSTIAMQLEQELLQRGYQTYVLDGDNVRGGLNRDLGFSAADRAENIRRIGEVAALMADAGLIVITAFISPYRADRELARRIQKEGFHEVFVDADLATCEARDPKGLYRKARAGLIPAFTGISDPYEAPERPELVLPTACCTVGECVEMLIGHVARHFAVTHQPARRAA
ncbi:MAG: adenylyl-sulfate kinase [Magnetococcales bacterium]|nr:adenylyl-sulfate kinase [Magnetococcales bacterium]